jgi:hypothetical protein
VVQKISKWSQDLKSVRKHHILACITVITGMLSIFGQVLGMPKIECKKHPKIQNLLFFGPKTWGKNMKCDWHPLFWIIFMKMACHNSAKSTLRSPESMLAGVPIWRVRVFG